MAIDKINIKYNNPVMDQENIEKIADKVNEIIESGTGSEIEPNPEDDATETLEKITIDDTVYGIPEGQKLYLHTITVIYNDTNVFSSNAVLTTNVILPTSTKLTFATLPSAIYDYYKGRSNFAYIPIIPVFKQLATSSNTLRCITGLNITSATTIAFAYHDIVLSTETIGSFSLSSGSVTITSSKVYDTHFNVHELAVTNS